MQCSPRSSAPWAQRELVADASHELRTPLTGLSANLQLLDEPGGLEAGDACEFVAQARGQAKELAALVSALVELARGSEMELHLDAVGWTSSQQQPPSA